MTATDELRRLLDERGVEYTFDNGYREFFWDIGETGTVRASAIGTNGLVQMIVTGITPEQAIEATLGRGECRFVTVVDQDPSRRHRGNIAECDCCGYRCAIGFIQDERFRFCPNCGRKVRA